MNVKVNGEIRQWDVPNISYKDVIELAGKKYEPWFSITYRRAIGYKGSLERDGILSRDETIPVTEDMIFNAYITNNA